MRHVLHLLVLLSATGCATTRYACPDTGDGDGWWRLRGEHVELRTDLEPRRAEALLAGLEQAWWAQEALTPPRAPGDRRVPLVVMEDAETLAALTGWSPREQSELPRTVPATMLSQTAGPVDLEGAVVVAHPLEPGALERGNHPAVLGMARWRLQRSLPAAPRWVTTGLSLVLSSTQVKDGTVRIGASPVYAVVDHAQIDARSPLEALWEESDGPEARDAAARRRFEATSWYWVSFLMAQHDARFLAFLRGLQQAPPREAWARAFVGVDAAQLDARGRQRPGGPFRSYRAPPVSRNVLRERLEPAEVHALHAQLRRAQAAAGVDARARAAWEQEVRLALARDPDEVTAHLNDPSLLEAPVAARLERARRLVHARPEDARAWRLLATTLQETAGEAEEQGRIWSEGARLFPHDAALQDGVAHWLTSNGRAAQALPAAETAARLQPFEARYADTLAATLATLGRCEDAARAQERALLLTAHDDARRVARTEALARYRAGCPASDTP